MSDLTNPKILNFLSVLKFNISKEPFIIDIGTGRGDFVSHCRHGGLGVHGTIGHYEVFEPIDYNIHDLVKRFASNKVVVNPFAIDLEDGEGTFHLIGNRTPEDAMSSLHNRPAFANFPRQEITVKKKRMDTWWSERFPNATAGIIDLINIDTEGNELRVLQSFGAILDGNIHARAIQFKYGLCWKDSGASIKDMKALLDNKGYALFEHLTFEGGRPLNIIEDDYETRTHDVFFAVSKKLWNIK